jgi:transcription antitermination protein NusB
MSESASMYHERQHARRLIMQYLFQCESERIGYFSETALSSFMQHYAARGHPEVVFIRSILRYLFEHRMDIDRRIVACLQNWNLKRLARTDRCVLRMAVAEILLEISPKRVVINEAIDIAREFGTEQSSRFVNGVLDKIVAGIEQDSIVLSAADNGAHFVETQI